MSVLTSVLRNLAYLFFLAVPCLYAANASAEELIVLDVFLNQEAVGELFMRQTSDGDIWIKRADLVQTRLSEGLGRDVIFEGERYVPMSSIPGLTFEIREKEASLMVHAPPSLFKRQSADISYKRPYEVEYPKNNSAFLNYGLIAGSGEPALNFSAEAGLRLGNYLATSTFNYMNGTDVNKVVRLMSAVTSEDRKTLMSFTAGDHSITSGIFGASVVLGGINISKNYAIDPYFIKFPALTLGGVLDTPSEIVVYVNGVPVRRENLRPGEFLVKNVPAIVGLGQADIVIKDAFGEERLVSRPYYYSDRLLKKGFHEYSYSLGFVREDLGEKSFSYGEPALVALHNYGFSDNLKAGYTLEASERLVNTGPAVSFLIRNAGVVNGALVVTSSEGKTGRGAFFDYSFRSRRLNAGIAVRTMTRDFSNLTIKPSAPKPSFEYSGSIGWTTGAMGSIALEYTKSKMDYAESTSRMAFSFNKILRRNVAFFASASRTDDISGTDNQLFFGLQMYFGGGVSGSISYTGNGDGDITQAGLQKSLPVGTGFGFIADVQKRKGGTDAFGDVRYQNDYGLYGLTFRRLKGNDEYAFSLSGGIGYIDKSFFLSRPIPDSFAKVKVADLEGVRVYHFGNEVGKTDRDGEIIIPLMSSYIDNKIDIENRDIPINYRISRLTTYVSPPLRGGAFVNFDVTKIQGITGQIFMIEKGRETPAESGEIHVLAGDRTISGLIGKNGEFYIENVPPGTHPAAIVSMQKECEFDIMIPESRDMVLDLGGVRCTIE